jgi:hypothetical protein
LPQMNRQQRVVRFRAALRERIVTNAREVLRFLRDRDAPREMIADMMGVSYEILETLEREYAANDRRRAAPGCV